MYLKNGYVNEACELIEYQLAIFRDKLGEKTIKYITMLSEVATLYMELGKCYESRRKLQLASHLSQYLNNHELSESIK